MPTDSVNYMFNEDFSLRLPDSSRTGKFLGKAVLIDNIKPTKMIVLVEVEKEARPIELTMFIPERELPPNQQAFPYRIDEEKKIITVTTDLRIVSNDKKLLFLSSRQWSVPFHRSVYEPYIEFETINKAIFSPKENE